MARSETAKQYEGSAPLLHVCVPVCECLRFAFSSRFWLTASEVYCSGATQDRKLTYKNGGTDCERYGSQGRSQDGRHWQARKWVFELTGIITLLNLLWSHGDSQVWTAFQDRKRTSEVSPCTWILLANNPAIKNKNKTLTQRFRPSSWVFSWFPYKMGLRWVRGGGDFPQD